MSKPIKKFKTYNFPVGTILTIKARTLLGGGGTYSDPFEDNEVPIKITSEYEKFLTGIVQQHNRKFSMGDVVPYPVTISKADLLTEDVEIMRIQYSREVYA